jgi:hypothetical protein
MSKSALLSRLATHNPDALWDALTAAPVAPRSVEPHDRAPLPRQPSTEKTVVARRKRS